MNKNHYLRIFYQIQKDMTFFQIFHHLFQHYIKLLISLTHLSHIHLPFLFREILIL